MNVNNNRRSLILFFRVEGISKWYLGFLSGIKYMNYSRSSNNPQTHLRIIKTRLQNAIDTEL